MTGLAPLLFMWLWSKGSGTAARPTMPAWPTAASPPPMPPAMPAFQSQPPPAPSADPHGSATPLAELHQAPPEVVPASATASTTARVVHPPASPAAKAAAAARKRVKASVPKAARGLFTVPLPPQKAVSVLTLQKIVNARGVKIAKDGLYGPKTANAWNALAKAKGLPPMISRVGPKIAKVVPQTYDALSVPAIP
jgi:hypothetical protein